jgi:uncharacterized delta-60 repeat protein
MSHRFTLCSALFAVAAVMQAGFASASDTSIDPGFGTDGWRRLYEPGGGTQDENGVAVARRSDGDFIVALELPGGAANSGAGKRIGLIRLDRNGNIVTSGFGTSGRVFKDAWLTSVTDMTIDAQGRILVVGSTPGPGGLPDFGVVRFNADGSDDTGFAGDGGTSFGFDVNGVDIDDAPTSVLADPDGRIVVAGNYAVGSIRRFSVVRFNTDGTLDSSFGSISDGAGGHRGSSDTFVDSKSAYASRILRIADGYYVITGTSVFSATDTDFAARILTPSGSQWASFAGSATFPIDEPGSGGSLFDSVNDAALVDPTTILLVGTASGKFAATRIKVGTDAGSTQYSTLNWDPSFVGSALAGRNYRYVGNTPNSDCRSAALRGDGRVLLVGGTSSTGISRSLDEVADPDGNSWARAGLVTRLNTDGSPDTGFGIGGSYPYLVPSGSGLSFYTSFERVRFDGFQPVVLGSAVDSGAAISDFDAVITRLETDVIFADGFQTHP